jgi:hypothetical protein
MAAYQQGGQPAQKFVALHDLLNFGNTLMSV